MYYRPTDTSTSIQRQLHGIAIFCFAYFDIPPYITNSKERKRVLCTTRTKDNKYQELSQISRYKPLNFMKNTLYILFSV